MHFRNVKKSMGDLHFEESIDIDKEGNQLTLMDIISEHECMVDKVDLIIKSQQLYKFIDKCLTPRESQIIKLRYGLYGLYPLTQREIAQKLGISRSYVSRIEKKALGILRKNYEK